MDPRPQSFRRRLRWQRGPSANQAALVPADVAQLYGLDALHAAGNYGLGQRIGFVEFAAPSASDDAAFWARYSLRPGLNAVPVTRVLSGGGDSTDGLGETDLDLQYAGALAPGAELFVYVIDQSLPLGNFLPALAAALRQAVADGVRICSLSLGAGEQQVAALGEIRDGSTGQVWPNAAAFAQALDAWISASGLCCFAAAGDAGLYAGIAAGDARVQASWPATQGAMIAVGGTQLVVPGDTRSGEQAWGGQTVDPAAPGYNPANTLPQASGGGGVSALVSEGGAGGRPTPDIAAFAGPLLVADQGQLGPVWGTSASAPIVAAMAAIWAQATGRIPDRAAWRAAANDVATGNNTNSQLWQAGLTQFAAAAAGPDLCTGTGVPAPARLPGG